MEQWWKWNEVLTDMPNREGIMKVGNFNQTGKH